MSGMDDKEKKDIRAFGLILAALLIFFAWRWGARGWSRTALWAAGLGAATFFAALAFPRRLQFLRENWMMVARAIGELNARILLGLIYYFVFTPCGLMVRLFSGDPLDRKWRKKDASYWKAHRTGDDLAGYERQF